MCLGIPLTIMVLLLFMNYTGELDNPSLWEYFSDLFYENTVAIILAGTLTVAILAGIRVFDIGLSETAQNVVFWTSAFGAAWAMLSILAWPQFVIIPFYPIIYVVLSLMYIMGTVMVAL